MSVGYQAVLWNRQKRIYDLCLLGGLIAYFVAFVVVSTMARPGITAETLLIRAFGTAGLVLLHVILCIGPLCRLDPRFLPLLYNRRHLGVIMFLLALAHGVLALLQFHSQGNVSVLVSVLTSNPRWDSVSQFPFQPLGALALLILFAMAATSHDFWLHNLSAPVWKALHMLVYVAYALLVLHVALGVLQAEVGWFGPLSLAAGVVTVASLHVAGAWREHDADVPTPGGVEFVDVCAVDEIEPDRARIVTLAGERVAVFRYDDRISAVSNVCQHQNGPLGEGRVIDGCITCPWHGYQYRPESGQSPPPFTERIPTFRCRVDGNRVLVDPRPLAPGTEVSPARIGAAS